MVKFSQRYPAVGFRVLSQKPNSRVKIRLKSKKYEAPVDPFPDEPRWSQLYWKQGRMSQGRRWKWIDRDCVVCATSFKVRYDKLHGVFYSKSPNHRSLVTGFYCGPKCSNSGRCDPYVQAEIKRRKKINVASYQAGKYPTI